MAARRRSPTRPAAPISPLTGHLGYWMRFVSNHVSHAFQLKVQQRGVTVAEWVVLRELYEHADGAAPSHLAARLHMTRGTVSKLVDRLEAKGLLGRSAHASDGRFQHLALSARGRELVPRLAALADANDAEFFGHLAAEERAQLERLLRGLVAHHRLTAIPTD